MALKKKTKIRPGSFPPWGQPFDRKLPVITQSTNWFGESRTVIDPGRLRADWGAPLPRPVRQNQVIVDFAAHECFLILV